mgnify:CR=1 FL=1
MPKASVYLSYLSASLGRGARVLVYYNYWGCAVVRLPACQVFGSSVIVGAGADGQSALPARWRERDLAALGGISRDLADPR